MPNEAGIGHAIAIIRNAFEPLVCIVEVDDRKGSLRFHIFDRNGTVLLSVPRLSVRDAVDLGKLNREVVDARARLERRGFALNTWKAPAGLAQIPRKRRTAR